MKRQILFRAKTLNEGKWVQSMTIANGTIERKKHNLYMEVGNDKWKGVDPDTLGQYTGVEDVNGKWIFEDDIVHFTFKNLLNQDRDAYVFYDKGEWMCQSLDSECNPTCLFPGHKAGIFDIAVIGNIHDNPELLKQ